MELYAFCFVLKTGVTNYKCKGNLDVNLFLKKVAEKQCTPVEQLKYMWLSRYACICRKHLSTPWLFELLVVGLCRLFRVRTYIHLDLNCSDLASLRLSSILSIY